MSSNRHRSGFTLRELLLTVGVMALMIRVALIAVPVPSSSETDAEDDNARPAEVERAAPARPEANRRPNLPRVSEQDPSSIVEVMPFSLHGNIPAPLLASILRQHRPELTDQHADDLMGTLPPGATHRMIVILPDKPAADDTF